MTQKLAYATAAGMVAFMIVLLGALAAYIVLHAGSVQTSTGNNTGGLTAPLQSTAPQGNVPNGTQSGSLDPSSDSGTQYAVSVDQAANIALSAVAGATLSQQPRLVNYQGTAAYEVQLDSGYLYVDATSGQVLYNGTTTGRQPRRGPRR